MLGRPAVHVSAQAPGATPTLLGDAVSDWTEIKATMMAIADAMPADKFTYKPTPAQRTWAEQIAHVAQANVAIMGTLGAKATPPAALKVGPTTSKAECLKFLGDSYDYGAAILRAQTNASMLEVIQGPSWIGRATRARIVWDTVGHAWDEYGVMTTYLRLNGIVPTASRGK